MMSPYLIRLLCLSFASFFLVYLALSIPSFAFARVAIRLSRRLRARLAARFLLCLRLGPLVAASLIVVGLCLPSYLLLEPRAAAERIGWICLVSALAGAAAWAAAIGRTLGALAGSHGKMRRCFRQGARLAGVPGRLPVLTVESEAPLLALAGLFRSRIVVSRGVLRALSPEELRAAFDHEQAHGTSRDNLKRLLLLLAPDPIPFFPLLGSLERCWARVAEWAADDRAAAGDSRRSLSLAAALVRVARLGAPARPVPTLMATLVGSEAEELSARVDRLLGPAPPCEGLGGPLRAAASSLALGASLLLAALILQPGMLDAVHRLLEHLVR